MSTRGMEGRGRRHWKSSGIMDNTIKFQMTMSKKYKNYSEDCLTICLKYLLFVYNIIFWVAGAVVLVIGSWTLSEKKDYLSLLPSSTFVVSAGILVFTGCLVTISGFLGCCAIVREQKSALVTYFSSLLLIFLVELIAGALACVYYQMLSEELKQHLNKTMVENYGKPGEGSVTDSIDRLQQDFKCCGSNSLSDWQYSVYINSPGSGNRLVPDSCCKTVTEACGQRDHPSNVYKVEGGCLAVLEQVLSDRLLIMGAVGIGVACLQLIGAVTTACFICVLIREEEEVYFQN
ncbi:tetraspanin-11-like isoform X11 [Narcine bancroftii]|uniref:tetraspanin-11-like isoform X11 n=1 Tax=Narcine bancroftii TaxID=1343680 RepID=UPI0038316EC1